MKHKKNCNIEKIKVDWWTPICTCTPVEKTERWEEDIAEILKEVDKQVYGILSHENYCRVFLKHPLNIGGCTCQREKVRSSLKSFIRALLTSHEAACRADERRKVVEVLRFDGKDILRGDYFENATFRGGYKRANTDLRAKLTGLDEK